MAVPDEWAILTESLSVANPAPSTVAHESNVHRFPCSQYEAHSNCASKQEMTVAVSLPHFANLTGDESRDCR
jgi:hypothetical protein